jgi:hypothetical protein
LHHKKKYYTFAIAFEKAGIIEEEEALRDSKKFDKKSVKNLWGSKVAIIFALPLRMSRGN